MHRLSLLVFALLLSSSDNASSYDASPHDSATRDPAAREENEGFVGEDFEQVSNAKTPLLAGIADEAPRLLLNLANRAIPGRISAEVTRFEAPATIVLEGVEVQDPEGRTVARVSRMVANAKLSSLLVGNIVIERLVVSEPILPLTMREGRLNILRAFLRDDDGSPESARPNIDVFLNAVVVKDGTATFEDADLKVSASGVNAHFKVELFVQSGHFLVRGDSASFAQGHVDMPEAGIPLVDVRTVDYALRATQLTIGTVTGLALGARFRANGNVMLQGAGRFDIKGDIDAPRDTWPEKVAKLPFSTPKAKASGSLAGSFKAPLVIVNARTEAFTAYEFPIERASANLVITRQAVAFADGAAVLKGGGSVSVEGTMRIAEKALVLDADVDRVPLRTALAPARLDESPTGTMSGAVQIEGPIDGPFVVKAGVRGRNVKGFSLASPVPLDVSAILVVRKTRVDIESAELEAPGLQASVSGQVDTDAGSLALAIAATIDDPGRFSADLPKDVRIARATFTGDVSGETANPRIEGQVAVSDTDVFGTKLDEVRSPLVFHKDVLRLNRIEGRLIGGTLAGGCVIRLGNQRTITAHLVVLGVDASLVRTPKGEELGASGQFDITADVDGTLDDPRVLVSARGSDVTIRGEDLGSVRLAATVTRDLVVVSEGFVDGRALQARVHSLRYAPTKETLQGAAHIESVDLGALTVLEKARVVGVLKGPVRISGTIDAPVIFAEVQVSGLMISDGVIGDGNGFVRLAPDKTTDKGLLAELSLFARGPSGHLEVRGAYALESRRVNARLEVSEVELAPFAALAGEGVPRMDGVLTGLIEVRGVIDAPDATFTFETPEVTFHPVDDDTVGPLQDSVTLARTRTRGRATLVGELKSGALTARLCAFPSDDAKDFVTGCEEPVRVFADLSGTVDLASGVVDLSLDAGLLENDIAVLIPALRRAGLEVAGQVRTDVDITRDKDGHVDLRGVATIEDLLLEPRNAPHARLVEPAFVRFTPGTVALERPMVLSVGERDVRINGSYNIDDETVAASLRGEFAIALVALFTNEINQPSGSVDAQVTLAGPVKRLAIEGCVAPRSGVAFTSRSLGRHIDLFSGEVCIDPVADSSSVGDGEDGLDRVRISGLSLGLDDGRATVDGSVVVALRSDDPLRIRAWDLAAEGNDLLFRSGRTWADIDFDLTLRGADTPVVRGRVEVQEGALRESFELANFVVTKKPGRPTAPIHETLRPFGLDDLAIDVDVVITSFETVAQASSVRVDGTVRGDLHIAETLRVPVLTGAIDVTDGRFQFPYATFTVEQSQIEFVRRADGRTVPRLFVVARTELEPPRNGLDTEVPVVLSLDGDLDQMKLDLHAEDTDVDVSQTMLFRYVLFGTPLSDSERSADAAGALRAVSSELTSAFTRDLEQTFAEELGTDVQLQVFYDDGRVSGGVRYALGRRIEIEGEAGILGTAKTDDTTPTSMGELRLRLLLLDHMPLKLGRQVAFVGQVRGASGTTTSDAASSDLRLTYRIFEY